MTTISPRSRALPGLRGALLVTEAMSIRSKRNWRGTFITGTIVPVCFLAALGVGLGSLVQESTFGGAEVSYLSYVAPALLASAAVQYAISESTDPVMAGFKWQRTYIATIATPVTSGQLMIGHLTWICVRVSLISVLFFLVMLLFGVVTSPVAGLALPFAVLGSMATAAPVMAFAATVRDGSSFTLLNRMVVVPMSLFAGTFFPISALPGVFQVLAWLTPLSHTVALTRGTALGGLSVPSAVVHVGVLVCWLMVGMVLAGRRFRLRLTP